MFTLLPCCSGVVLIVYTWQPGENQIVLIAGGCSRLLTSREHYLLMIHSNIGLCSINLQRKTYTTKAQFNLLKMRQGVFLTPARMRALFSRSKTVPVTFTVFVKAILIYMQGRGRKYSLHVSPLRIAGFLTAYTSC